MESNNALKIITVIAANEKWKKWYKKNRKHFFELVNKHKKNRRNEFKELIENRKSEGSCKRCHKNYHPAAMDFVHRDGEDKNFSISDASRKIYSKDKLIAEMDKCDLICANCQKILKMENFLKDSKGNEKKNRRRHKLLEAINSIKTKPCLDCEQKFPPYCMELDHTGKGGDKVDSIARMVNQEKPNEVIMNELKKVESICTNCHRKRTYERAHKK